MSELSSQKTLERRSRSIFLPVPLEGRTEDELAGLATSVFTTVYDCWGILSQKNPNERNFLPPGALKRQKAVKGIISAPKYLKSFGEGILFWTHQRWDLCVTQRLRNEPMDCESDTNINLYRVRTFLNHYRQSAGNEKKT